MSGRDYSEAVVNEFFDKAKAVTAIFLLAFIASAAGLLAALAVIRVNPDLPVPTPAPIISPYVNPGCDGSCRNSTPSFKPFDVICPYCSRRFRVNPAPGKSTGDKPPVGEKIKTRLAKDATEPECAYKKMKRLGLLGCWQFLL